MIKEYAMTPHIFDFDRHHDSSCHDALKMIINKPYFAKGIVFTDYDDCSFSREIADIGKQLLKDDKRKEAQILFDWEKLLKNRYVYRPSGDEYNTSEEDWYKRAQALNEKTPIDYIVVTPAYQQANPDQPVKSIDNSDTIKSFLFNHNDSCLFLLPSIDAEVSAIERMLHLSDTIRVVVPYFCSGIAKNGDCNTLPEASFPMSLLKRKVKNCSNMRSLKYFDMVTNIPEGREKPEDRKSVAESIIRYIQTEVGDFFDIRIFLCDHNQREFLFGNTNHNNDFIPFCGLSVNHYAIEEKHKRTDPDRFMLMDAKEFSQFRDYYFPKGQQPDATS